MLEDLEYCCPVCKGELARAGERYRCEACARDYPIVWGIPDFRVFPDPYISIPEDHRKGLRIAGEYERRDFKGLAEFYWSITPETPAELVRRFMRFDLAGVERGRQMLRTIAAEEPRLAMGEGARCLELGCRTGGFLVAAAERFGHVVGIDIAFRWLIVARKRLEEAGRRAQLVCCCAQYLPFREKQFDLVVAGNVIEHSQRQERLVTDAYRVLRDRGVFFIITCNRLSIAPEPHVRVWGAGWLPEKWRRPYVKWVRGVEYDHVHLLSIFELAEMIRRRGFRRYRADPPGFGQGEQEGMSPKERAAIAIYNRVRKLPGVREVLLAAGPLLQIICVRRDADNL